MGRNFLPGTLIALGILVPAAGADTITLTNGRVIEADRTWYDGPQIMYEKNGGIFGLPRSLVRKLDQKSAPDPAADPDVLRACERLAAGDPVEATRLLHVALARDARSIPALQALSEAYLALGDPGKARDVAERALRLNERDPRSHLMVGDALAALGDRAGAEDQYRKSLKLHPDSEVQRKLGEVAPAPSAAPARGAQFRIRYDGGVNEPLGMEVLQALTRAHEEYAKRLGGSPEGAVTVVLQAEAGFEDTRVPEWAAGLNDGTIHVPLRGVERLTPRLVAILRHELGHSFITSRTGGNCPTWLQEGLSQWLEGGDPAREDGVVAAAARDGKLIPLLSLEPPFQGLSEADAILAYAESLSAVAFIARTRGEAAIVRVLAALADRLPSEEALPVALALSYPELQRAWEESLKSASAGTSPR